MSVKVIRTNEEIIPFYNEKYTYPTYGIASTAEVAIQQPPQQTKTEKQKYPIGVLFILGSKFFEAYSANGIRTILALYLRDYLRYSQQFSTLILHVFNFFGQFCPIVGGIMADSYCGNIRTIFIFFICYAIGWTGMIMSNIQMLTFTVPLLFISLLLIATGNGSIRGCVTTVGGQQFTLPEQDKQLDQYFTHYMIQYNLGILLSKIIPPSVRAHTQCFGRDTCYLAVYGMLGGTFLIAWTIYLIGMFFYKKEEDPKGNVMGQVYGCIAYAIHRKIKRQTPPNTTWIYGSIGKYTESFVKEVEVYLRFLVLYLPLPIYWSLLTQLDSSWTFQATQLNTSAFGYVIQPDQVKSFGYALLLIFIITWQRFLEPILYKKNVIVSPLRNIIFGGCCAVVAFVLAAVLETKIEQNTGQPYSIYWQIPQFVFLMIAETLISISGLKFAFTEAPESLKSVLTATWFMNNAIGNLIVVIITQLHMFEKQSYAFFLYAALMLIAISIFSKLAKQYEVRYLNTEGREQQINQTAIHHMRTVESF